MEMYLLKNQGKGVWKNGRSPFFHTPPILSRRYMEILDRFPALHIIQANSITKDVEEDEYALCWRYREQDMVRTCPHDGAEWTSESQG